MSAQCDSCLHSVATAGVAVVCTAWQLSAQHGIFAVSNSVTIPGSSFENVAVVKYIMDIIYKDMAVNICRSRTEYKVLYIIMFVNGQT